VWHIAHEAGTLPPGTPWAEMTSEESSVPTPDQRTSPFSEPGDLFASAAFMAFGACRGVDPDVFFPDRGESLEPAKRVCGDCAVRNECLEHALSTGERFGVWGGTSERERRRLRRQRRVAAA
jgi:WhiB family transcriptional regulator, redox-sensing transcriptional regulator